MLPSRILGLVFVFIYGFVTFNIKYVCGVCHHLLRRWLSGWITQNLTTFMSLFGWTYTIARLWDYPEVHFPLCHRLPSVCIHVRHGTSKEMRLSDLSIDTCNLSTHWNPERHCSLTVAWIRIHRELFWCVLFVIPVFSLTRHGNSEWLRFRWLIFISGYSTLWLCCALYSASTGWEKNCGGRTCVTAIKVSVELTQHTSAYLW